MKNFDFTYIGSANSSAKIAKGEKIGIDTFVVYLAAGSSSGYNVCPGATVECLEGCLVNSGRVIMDVNGSIMKARIERTKAFYSDRAGFMAQLVKEITAAKRKAERRNHEFCVRINGTSDLSPVIWKYEGKTLFELFPDVQFYDYTKILNRIALLHKFSNYDLTFSYSGHNWDKCLQAINSGIRVAVVFKVKKGKPLPATFRGLHVIDGDVTDYRPADPSACIVGLRFKKIKDKAAMQFVLNSPFVIDPAFELETVNN
jgi:hypothetical protein